MGRTKTKPSKVHSHEWYQIRHNQDSLKVWEKKARENQSNKLQLLFTNLAKEGAIRNKQYTSYKKSDLSGPEGSGWVNAHGLERSPRNKAQHAPFMRRNIHLQKVRQVQAVKQRPPATGDVSVLEAMRMIDSRNRPTVGQRYQEINGKRWPGPSSIRNATANINQILHH